MKIYQIQINPETCTVDVVMGNGKLGNLQKVYFSSLKSQKQPIIFYSY